MKKLLIILVGMLLTFALAAPASANLTWNYAYADGGGNSLTSPYASSFDVVIDTFQGDARPGWTYEGSFAIRTGTQAGLAAAPWSELTEERNTTSYLAVPEDINDDPKSVTVGFGGASYNYLGLMWGSMDDYNKITFMSGNNEVGSLTGSDVVRDSTQYLGDQEIGYSNAYVNIFSDVKFDSITIESTNYAFELDNLAVGVVPAPGAILLAGMGTVFAGWIKRRRMLN